MRLTVLGTATPFPRPDNPCSGYLLQGGTVDDESGGADAPGATVWIDAGAGTLAELQRHTSIGALDAIWISHRHADHAADLLVAYYALRFAEGRPEHPVPLPLIAPEGMLERLSAFLGPSSVDELPRVFDFRPMSGWGEAVFGSLTLSWGPVQHGVPAFGLTVDEGGRRLAYSGDCAPCLSLEEIGENADLLLVEAGYDRAPEGEPAVHHTPEEAGRSAATAGAARLVLTHLAESLVPDAARARAATAYAGPIELAHPGAVFLV
ncbi:MBL fold metallo-hydrolase [Herbiconiux sp.]|uniref:MBL fold metallo-hydrolase n=1 Tax=Herbiconiux sp. TaxID=1871186 RepID=UPI0025C30D52|nr:MBL fold metallo-hydrolase [Herbiconiux sp.]